MTQQGLQRASLNQLQSNLSEMARLQERLTTGKVITKPSDDPAGTVDAMRLRSDQRATAQQARNAADGNSWLTTIDSALGDALTSLRNARNLTVQGSNTGSQGQMSLSAIASELRATADSLFETANTTYLGRSVFAGSSTGAAYSRTDAGTFTYAENAGTPVLRQVSDTVKVRVDSTGSDVFGVDVVDANGDLVLGADGEPVGMSVFSLLRHVADKVEAGDPDVGKYLTEIDSRMNAFLSEVGSVGTRHKQVMQAQEALDTRKITLTNQLSSVEDADLAETIVDIQLQEVGYQAALGATSRVLQPSLLDFLR
ncbi:flagellin [Georgenia phoenicis]|uniref:flagellin N-terminal helical domain-containing protein n=1 Tax=unclassified Georgenia TaxID=2626815 RepID=UPI0039AED1D2